MYQSKDMKEIKCRMSEALKEVNCSWSQVGWVWESDPGDQRNW